MATATTINDYVKGYDKNTKDIADTNKRISDIVSNNGNGTKDVEIVDARKGKASLRDRIDEVENKISINNDVMTKELVDARTDFDGGIHKNLNLRLLKDFNNLYKLIYNSTLLEYEGQYITANNSYKGMTEDMQVKGKTYQNLLTNIRNDILLQFGAVANWTGFKTNTVYTIRVFNKTSEVKQFYTNEYCFTSATEFTVQPSKATVIKATTLATFSGAQSTIEVLLKNKITHTQNNNIEVTVLEGDYTNKPIPNYFEGIRSVGEPEETLEIVSCSKNLLKITDTPDNKVNVTFTKLDNGFRIKGLWYVGFKVPLTQNNQYYISFNKNIISGTASKVLIYDFTQKIQVTNTLVQSGVLTINGTYDKNNTYLVFYCGDGKEGEVEFTDIAFYEGIVTTPYEPYKEHRQPITLTESLKSLSNSICDILDFKKVKLTRNIGKVTFKGDENIVLATTKVNTIVFAIDVAPALVYTDIYNIMCDKFAVGINVVDEKLDVEGARIVSNASRVYISILKSKLTPSDVTGFKAWLKANPTTVYYQLATPVETPIDVIPPRTYEEVTNIFTTGSLIEPVLKCKVSSNIPAKIQTLSMGNQALKMENTMLRNTVEENNLTGIENSVNQESKITMMELGVI